MARKRISSKETPKTAFLRRQKSAFGVFAQSLWVSDRLQVALKEDGGGDMIMNTNVIFDHLSFQTRYSKTAGNEMSGGRNVL